eukprot:5288800-Amphidinium_carterae.1
MAIFLGGTVAPQRGSAELGHRTAQHYFDLRCLHDKWHCHWSPPATSSHRKSAWYPALRPIRLHLGDKRL